MASARIVTNLADRYAVADLAQLGFGVPGPQWKNRAQRLSCPRRARADHWLWEHDGQPVSALLSYPLCFTTADGRVVDGFGLGAVSTHPDARRQGHASALCAAVAEYEASRGRRTALLFSGIAPEYYERLGYHRCVAADWVTSRLEELSSSGPRAQLHVVSPHEMLPSLARCYEDFHRGVFHLHRDTDAWRRTFTHDPPDWWFSIGDPGADRGYVRCSRDGESLDLLEVVICQSRDEAPVFRALAALAVEVDLEKMGGWMRSSSFVQGWFEDTGRSTTLPMVMGGGDLAGAQFWSSDYF